MTTKKTTQLIITAATPSNIKQQKATSATTITTITNDSNSNNDKQ